MRTSAFATTRLVGLLRWHPESHQSPQAHAVPKPDRPEPRRQRSRAGHRFKSFLLLSCANSHSTNPQQRKTPSTERSPGSDSDESSNRWVSERWPCTCAYSRAPHSSNAEEFRLTLRTPKPVTKKTKRAL